MITASTILFGIIGLLISSLIKLAKMQKKLKNFSFKFWFKDNLIQNIATLLMLFVLLWFAPTLATGVLGIHVHENSQFYEIFALLAGWNNHAMFYDFMKAYNKKNGNGA